MARRGRPLIAKVSKKTIRNVALFAILVVSLYLLLPQVVDARKTLRLLAEANKWLLVLALILEATALLFYGQLTRYVFSVVDIKMRLRDVLAITLSSLAVSHVLSAGGVGGWVVTYNALRKRGVPHGLIFVAIAAQQFFNYIVLWTAFGIALVYLVIGLHQSIVTYLAAIVLIVLLLWAGGYGLYLYHHRARLRLRLGQLAAFVNRVFRREVIHEDLIDGWLDNLFAGMRRFASHRGAARKAAALSASFTLCDMAALGAVMYAFGAPVGIGFLAVSYIVAYAVGTLAPTPGGLGAIEGLLIATLAGFGMPFATAVSVVLVYRLINFWLPVIPGLIAHAVVRPGRRTVSTTEIAQAADEECVVHPYPEAECAPAASTPAPTAPADSDTNGSSVARPRRRFMRARRTRGTGGEQQITVPWKELRRRTGNGNGRGAAKTKPADGGSSSGGGGGERSSNGGETDGGTSGDGAHPGRDGKARRQSASRPPD